jgi:hypothetical protein
MKKARLFCFTIFILFLVISLSFAGVVYEEVEELQGIDLKAIGGEQKTVKKIYVTPNKKKEVLPHKIEIIRIDKEVMWIFSPESKFYVEKTFKDIKKFASVFMHPQVFTQMGKMMGDMQIVVKRTGRKQNINGFNCEQVLITYKSKGGDFVLEQWITTELPSDLAKFNKNLAKMMKKDLEVPKELESMEKQMGLDQKTKKLLNNGLIIKSVSNFGGMKTITEIRNLKETSIPDREFNLPSGYKKMIIPVD